MAMNELQIKYHNDLNYIALEKFDAVEMDLFMAVCLLMRDKGTLKEELTLSEIRNVSGYKSTSLVRLNKDMEQVRKKLRNLNYASINTDQFDGDIYLFSAFGRSKEKPNTWIISINEYATYILNHLTEEWTMFRLTEYTNLRSRYSKTLYRFLKQWRTVGKFTISTDDFKQFMDIPEKYPISKIDERVLQPALTEIAPYFKNLSVKKLYQSSHKKGRSSVKGYIFSFDAE